MHATSSVDKGMHTGTDIAIATCTSRDHDQVPDRDMYPGVDMHVARIDREVVRGGLGGALLNPM